MSRIRLRHIQSYVDRRDGVVYHYFRRRGYPRVRLPGLPGSAEFMAAYREALGHEPLPIGIKCSQAGSVAAAVAAYLVSPDFVATSAGNSGGTPGNP
jgi:hypothetical protein